jgi:hypothetical protein
MHCDVTLIRARLAISYIVGEHTDSPLDLEGSPGYTFHLGLRHAGIKRVCLVPLAYSERRRKFFGDIGCSRETGLYVMKFCRCHITCELSSPLCHL